MNVDRTNCRSGADRRHAARYLRDRPVCPGRNRAVLDGRVARVAALERLREAGIKTIADPAAGFEAYVSLRERWDGHIARLRASMKYEADEIDAPTYRQELAGGRPPFEHRLHDV